VDFSLYFNKEFLVSKNIDVLSVLGTFIEDIIIIIIT
jgi:hypothetical protein